MQRVLFWLSGPLQDLIMPLEEKVSKLGTMYTTYMSMETFTNLVSSIRLFRKYPTLQKLLIKRFLFNHISEQLEQMPEHHNKKAQRVEDRLDEP